MGPNANAMLLATLYQFITDEFLSEHKRLKGTNKLEKNDAIEKVFRIVRENIDTITKTIRSKDRDTPLLIKDLNIGIEWATVVFGEDEVKCIMKFNSTFVVKNEYKGDKINNLVVRIPTKYMID